MIKETAKMHIWVCVRERQKLAEPQEEIHRK